MVATIALSNGVQAELAALAGKSPEFRASGHGKGDAVHEVVMVASRIGDQFCRLRLANLVRGLRVRAFAADGQLPGLGIDLRNVREVISHIKVAHKRRRSA